MVDGFFLGGAAAGADTARARGQRDVALAQQQQQLGLGERRLTEDVRLREQAQDIQRRALADAERRRTQQRALSIANEGIKFMQGAIVTLRQQGKTPEEIERIITPLFRSFAQPGPLGRLKQEGKLPEGFQVDDAMSGGTFAMAGLDATQIERQLRLGIQAAPQSEGQQFAAALQQTQAAPPAGAVTPETAIAPETAEAAPAIAAPTPAPLPAQPFATGLETLEATTIAPQTVQGATVPPTLSPDAQPTEIIRPTPQAVQAASRLAELNDVTGARELIREDVARQAAASDPNAGRFKDAGERFRAQQSLRKEFLAASSEFIKIRRAFNRVQASQDTGPGDVALIFNFMKMLDPTSTVREGEFATAEQTAGIPQRFVAQYNKAIRGERLVEAQRKQIKAQVAQLFKAPFQQHQKRISMYTGLAEANGLDPKNVAVNITGDFLVTPGGQVVRVKP